MNIFVLDTDPIEAARAQCNKHVVKMIVESAQMLCTALYINGASAKLLPYRPTHSKHPCTLWAAASDDNFAWLLLHAQELCDEYYRRYGRRHKTADVLDEISQIASIGDWESHTPFALAMPPQYKCSDPVQSYRDYYIAEKSRFAKWRPRTLAPTWWPFEEAK